jgi:hypothetical protein
VPVLRLSLFLPPLPADRIPRDCLFVEGGAWICEVGTRKAPLPFVVASGGRFVGSGSGSRVQRRMAHAMKVMTARRTYTPRTPMATSVPSQLEWAIFASLCPVGVATGIDPLVADGITLDVVNVDAIL